MTTTIVFGDTTDGYVQSANASYTTMRTGSSMVADTGGTPIVWGQNNNGGSYMGFQTFLSFTYLVPTNEKITAAYIRVKARGNLNTSLSRAFTWVEYNWGGTLTTAAWRTPTQIAALTPLLANIINAEDAGTGYMTAGSDALVTRLGSVGPLRVMGASDKLRTGTTPTTDEGSSFWSSDTSGTADDPTLVFTSVPSSRLFTVLGAQVQLSDGTHAYLEAQNEVGSSVLLKHHNGTTASTVATIPIGTAATDFAAGVGSQALSLTASSADHLYVIGAQGSNPGGSLATKAYSKGVGYTWAAQTTLAATLPSYTEGKFNNFAGAWHNVGTSGTIMVVAAHTAGRTPNTTGDIVYALLSCQSLLAGSGTLLRNSGSARGIVVSGGVSSAYYTSFVNETGSVLDVVSAPGTNDRGYVLSCQGTAQPGDQYPVAVYRYILASDGTSLSASAGATSTSSCVKDASAKVRVIGLDGTSFILVSVDPDSGAGVAVDVLQNSGTSATFSRLGSAFLDNDGGASMPSAGTLSASSAWDAIYDSAGKKLWVYYLDVANSNRLLRTSVDMNTYLAATDEVQVSAAIGAVGSTNYAVRVHRGKTNGQRILVSVANKTSGGTHSTIYIADLLNLPPNAPTLTAKANFDATTAATFSWTFSDPNAGDTQSAYQIQIVDVSDGSVDVDYTSSPDTGMHTVAAGVLANGKSYQWRVRTWDTSNAVGPYSSYGTFSTATGGTVTITDPVSDNPAGMNRDDYTIQWSVASTTQASYRVVVTRTGTGATLVNTGYVTSTATSYNVAGMLPGVEYTVAVTVRNAALVESATGTRKITPDYDNVPQPTVSAAPAISGEYITVSVTNGTPTGDNPSATSNQILRRRADSTGDYTVIATIDPDNSYDDYAVASGVTYEYIARAVA